MPRTRRTTIFGQVVWPAMMLVVTGLVPVGTACRESSSDPPGRPAAAEDSESTTRRERPDRDSPAAGLLRIAVIPKATSHEYWKSIHAGARKAELELEGVRVIWSGPAREDDRVQQIAEVENAVNAGCHGIVLAPLDEVALVRPVREARRAGIPVLIMDSALQGTPGTDYVSYVATDNHEAGIKAARRMIEVLDGRGRILVLRYQVGSASTTARETGFLEQIALHPSIQVLAADYPAGPTTEDAFNKTANLLRVHHQVDGIFGPCEPVVFGALRALQEAGLAGRVRLVGFDTSAKLVEAMRRNHLHGLVLQDPLEMGYQAVRTLVAHLRGAKVAARIDTGSVVATPENMDSPLIQGLLVPPIDQYLK